MQTSKEDACFHTTSAGMLGTADNITFNVGKSYNLEEVQCFVFISFIIH